MIHNKAKKFLQEAFLVELKKAEEDGLYGGDYLDFDPMGYLRVRCMRCGEEIAQRQKTAQKQYILVPHENYCQVFKQLTDGTIAGFLVCDKCSEIIDTCDNEDKKRLIAVAQSGWAQEMINAQRDELLIHAYMAKKKDLRIL